MPGKFGDGQWSKFWGATNHMLDSVLPGSNPLNFTPPLLVNCPLLFHVGPPPPFFWPFSLPFILYFANFDKIALFSQVLQRRRNPRRNSSRNSSRNPRRNLVTISIKKPNELHWLYHNLHTILNWVKFLNQNKVLKKYFRRKLSHSDISPV